MVMEPRVFGPSGREKTTRRVRRVHDGNPIGRNIGREPCVHVGRTRHGCSDPLQSRVGRLGCAGVADGAFVRRKSWRFSAGPRFKRGRGRNCGYCHCHRIGDFGRSPTSEPCGSSFKPDLTPLGRSPSGCPQANSRGLIALPTFSTGRGDVASQGRSLEPVGTNLLRLRQKNIISLEVEWSLTPEFSRR